MPVQLSDPPGSMGITLDPEEYFEVFGESDPRQHADEVQARWGETDAYAESHPRTSGYSKEDWLRAQQQKAAVEAEFGACMAAFVHAAIYADALTR